MGIVMDLLRPMVQTSATLPLQRNRRHTDAGRQEFPICHVANIRPVGPVFLGVDDCNPHGIERRSF